jgi:hypothetical protein
LVTSWLRAADVSSASTPMTFCRSINTIRSRTLASGKTLLIPWY